jgi:Fe-S-cluster containining protein
MQDIPKFKCSACGKCCSKIQGFISKEEEEFIRKYGYGKMPLMQVIPMEEMSFLLWDFEAKRFKEYEKEVEIDAKIRPSRGVFDLKSNRFIVFTYHMNSEACPFLLDEGKCAIYDNSRSFVCQFFPFKRSPLLKLEEESDDLFGSCPNISIIISKLDYSDKKKLVKELYDSFGENFLAALQNDIIMEWSNRLIIELMKNEMIKPAINHPYEFLKKRIDNSEKIDLMDFLVEIGYKNREEIDEMIERFENLEDAKEKVKEYIV